MKITFSICKVGDCGLQTYQIVTILRRATTLEVTTVSPILYTLLGSVNNWEMAILLSILQHQSNQ